jgi:hypothetical protein
MANKFSKGDRVTSERASGTVVATYWSEHNVPQGRVDVRWDDGGKSHRPEDGLSKLPPSAPLPMSAEQLRAAMAALGASWGRDRPLHNAELGRALRLKGRDPGATVEAWLKSAPPITGPASVAVKMMLAGALPPDPLEIILRPR